MGSGVRPLSLDREVENDLNSIEARGSGGPLIGPRTQSPPPKMEPLAPEPQKPRASIDSIDRTIEIDRGSGFLARRAKKALRPSNLLKFEGRKALRLKMSLTPLRPSKRPQI